MNQVYNSIYDWFIGSLIIDLGNFCAWIASN